MDSSTAIVRVQPNSSLPTELLAEPQTDEVASPSPLSTLVSAVEQLATSEDEREDFEEHHSNPHQITNDEDLDDLPFQMSGELGRYASAHLNVRGCRRLSLGQHFEGVPRPLR